MSQTKAQLVGGVGFSTADSLTVHNGLAVTGVVTATSFAGNISGDATGLTGSPNITVTNITASGNVTIGGTLTYEDVTNIDAIGIVTARSGINITGAGMTVTGISTFRGDVQVADKIVHLDDSNTAIRFPAADTFTVETSGSEALRITSAGDVGIGTDNPGAKLDVDGTLNVPGVSTFQSDIHLGDNDVLNFGDGNDLRIYHSGSGSLISENGTGRLRIGAGNEITIENAAFSEYKARFFTNGAVELYYDNSKKFETTGAGVTVTGTLNASGIITAEAGAIAEIDTLTSASTVTPDFAASCNFTLTLGTNVLLENPSNLTAGQSGSIFLIQDGTGSRTLSFGTYWDFAGGTPPTISTVGGSVDRLDYIVRSSTSIHAVVTLAYS